MKISLAVTLVSRSIYMVQIFLNHKKEFNTVTVKQAKFIMLDGFFFFFKYHVRR